MLNNSSPYELKIIVKSGHVHGGGLPNDTFVEVFIDGELFDTTPVAAPHHDWNQVMTKKFSKIVTTTPIILSFSVYKKRWTSVGFKLVGTVSFPLSDLCGIVNKGLVEKTYDLLSNRKNLTLCGNLLLEFDLTQEIKHHRHHSSVSANNESQRKNSTDSVDTSAKDSTEVKKPSFYQTQLDLLTSYLNTIYSTIEPILTHLTLRNVLIACLILVLLYLFYKDIKEQQLAHIQLQTLDQQLNLMEKKLRTHLIKSWSKQCVDGVCSNI